MTESKTNRRNLLSVGALGGAAVLVAATSAQAQSPASAGTLQRIRDRGELRIGVAPGEPWFYKDQRTNEWHGIGWGIGLLLAKELNVKPVPVETTWGNAVAGLQADQFDIMFVLDATPQRALAVDFPAQPMFYSAMGLLVRDGVTATNWSDLDKPEIRIGAVLGTVPERDVTQRLPKAQIERFPNADETAAAFQAGRIDAIALFHPALVMLQSRTKKGKVVLPAPIKVSATSAGVRRDADKSWRDWVGLAIGYFYTTGETQKVYDAYLKFRNIDPAQAPSIVREQWPSKT